jgi:hypothetical protein
VAETNSLLNCRTGYSVPGVRIPLSPPSPAVAPSEGGLRLMVSSIKRAPFSSQAGFGGRGPLSLDKVGELTKGASVVGLRQMVSSY